MDTTLANLGEIGALLGSAAYFAHLSVNGVTLAFPKRPPWIALAGALAFGILFTTLLAISNGVVFHNGSMVQTIAQITLVGIAAGAGAAGTSVTQASAEAKRQESKQPTTQPDPLTPESQPATLRMNKISGSQQ